MDLRNKIKKLPPIKITVIAYKTFRSKYSLRNNIAFFDFLGDYKTYKKLLKNNIFSLEIADLYPRLFDNTLKTPIDSVYFYQDI